MLPFRVMPRCFLCIPEEANTTYDILLSVRFAEVLDHSSNVAGGRELKSRSAAGSSRILSVWESR